MTTWTPLAGERVEIDRERCDQRLAFAGLHLGDVALMQHHAADQLHVEMALAERALGGLAHGGEGRHQDVVERLAVGQVFAELFGAGLQRLVGERFDLRLQRIDGVDAGLISLDPAVVGGAEKLAGERADHAKFLFLRCCSRAVKPSSQFEHDLIGKPVPTFPGHALNCPSTHRDASRCHAPRPGVIRQLSGKRAIQGSTAKTRSKINAIAVDTMGQRYGRAGAMSTWPERTAAAGKFIILTGFSRCQAPPIGRVSRRPTTPCLTLRILHDHLVPGNENRPAFRPCHGRRDLCRFGPVCAGSPARADDKVLAKVNGVEIKESDVALAEEELAPSLQQMDPAAKKENVLAFLIDLQIVAKAAEDKKIENSDDFKKRLAFTRKRLMMDSLLAAEGKAATTDGRHEEGL